MLETLSKYGPLVWLGNKITRKVHHDTPKVPGKQD
jgi:hypothetical protein